MSWGVATQNGVSVSLASIVSLSCGATEAPFTPADLFSAGQQGVWYDFTDPAYIFQNTAGTIPAVNGTTVLRANDRSGNGNHWITVAGGQNAFYSIDASSKGVPSPIFQGNLGAGYGVTAAAIPWASNAVTILCAYEILVEGTASTMLASSQTVTSTNGTFVIRSQVTGIGNDIEAAVKQNIGAPAGYKMNLTGPSETLVFCSVIDNGGANKAAKLTTVSGQSPSFIKNNTTVPSASLTSTGAATTTGTGNSITTQVLVLGAENTTGLNAFAGYLYGVIIRAGILTPTEITNTSAWLNAKCNAY